MPKHKNKEKRQKIIQETKLFVKNCGRQFIGNHALICKGCHSDLTQRILKMPVRGIGIRDISVIENISTKKVLPVLVDSNRIITPGQQHYDSLEVDEFWTYAGNKKNKVWLIYAYHRVAGEIVVFVWEKRNHKTANKLREKLSSLGVNFDTVYTDGWGSFKGAFLQIITVQVKRIQLVLKEITVD